MKMLLHSELFLSCFSSCWGSGGGAPRASLSSNAVPKEFVHVKVSFPLCGVTYNCWWGDVDACDGSWADVIDQVAEDHAIHECSPQVFVQADLESHLNALGRKQREATCHQATEGQIQLRVFMNWDLTSLWGRRMGTLGKHWHCLFPKDIVKILL